MRSWLVLALLLAVPSAPEVHVAVRDGQVALKTTRAPLADVLKKLADATGMEVVYESTRPRQLVTVTIEAGSAAEALQQLLEGQGLNYILRLDATGQLVQTLVVAGTGSSSPAPAASARGSRASPPPFRPPQDLAEEAPGDEGDLMPDEAQGGEAAEPFEPPAAPPVEPVSPGQGTMPGPVPGVMPGGGSGVVPGTAPGQEPSAAQSPTGGPEAGQPQPPGPASYPGGYPGPQAPVPPGPASYP